MVTSGYRTKTRFVCLINLCSLLWPLTILFTLYIIALLKIDGKFGISTQERTDWLDEIFEKIEHWCNISTEHIFAKEYWESRKEDKEFERNEEDLMFERMGINLKERR
jgi:hypothetical protein